MEVDDTGRAKADRLTDEIVDQIWAEAVAAFDAGEKWYLKSDDEDLAREVQAQHTMVSDLQGVIQEFLEKEKKRIEEFWREHSIERKQFEETITQKKALIEKFTCSQDFKDSLKKSQDQKPTVFQWITALFLIQTIFYTRRGITMFKELSNASKSASKQLEKLQKEHNAIFTRFLQNQIPLKGVLQKGLQGKPEAFPDIQLLCELGIAERAAGGAA